jgi:ADP-ribosylglycohydrolase
VDRFRGSLLAGAVGDALGAAIEFGHMDTIRAR